MIQGEDTMFYYLSLIIPISLILPNILYAFKGAINIPNKENLKINPVLLICEKLGQISIFIIPIFYKISLNDTSMFCLIPIMSFFLMMYYAVWLRFFLFERDYKYLFESLSKIPIPLAVIPIIYMTLASILLNSPLLLISTLIFSIGHIHISYKEYTNINSFNLEK